MRSRLKNIYHTQSLNFQICIQNYFCFQGYEAFTDGETPPLLRLCPPNSDLLEYKVAAEESEASGDADVKNLTPEEEQDVKPFVFVECEETYAPTKSSSVVAGKMKGSETFDCAHCGKSFSRKHYLIRHMKSHTNIKLCREESKLADHQKAHLGIKPFQCKDCQKCFKFKSNLTRHVKLHRNQGFVTSEQTHSGIKLLECNECGKRFTSKSSMMLHARIHTGIKPHRCEQCDKAFTQKGDLTNHQRTHSGMKPFKCDMCDKAFAQQGHLSRHRKSRVHSDEKLCLCSLCKKSFTQKSSLVAHLWRCHSDTTQLLGKQIPENSFVCDQCDKRFSYKYLLVRHQFVHSGFKPHKCSECSKSFFTKSKLNVHLVKHLSPYSSSTSLKVYSCSFCGKCFGLQGDLTIHERKHTGERPYSCNYCGHSCAHKSNLARHIQSHHESCM